MINLEEKTKINIVSLESCASTNDEAYALAKSGAESGTVVTALSQTGGRGTNSRSFFSPGKTGIYMSVILREAVPDRLLDITPMAAVAVSRVLDRMFGVRTKIKWVNDIYLNGKKVCGILTQAQSAGSKVDFIVVGIGINLFEPQGGFPQDIKDIAGFVSSEYNEEKRLEAIESIALELVHSNQMLSDDGFLSQMRAYYTERRYEPNSINVAQ